MFFGKSFKAVHVYVGRGKINPHHTLVICLENEYVGKSFNCQCVYDGKNVIGQWAVVSGN